jgi:hypothetical protein
MNITTVTPELAVPGTGEDNRYQDNDDESNISTNEHFEEDDWKGNLSTELIAKQSEQNITNINSDNAVIMAIRSHGLGIQYKE